MRILFLSSVFPQPYEPTRGVFSLHLCRALAARHEVRVICPTPWLERLGHGQCVWPDGTELLEDVSYPTYYYPPRLFPNASGWFMWASIRRTVRKVLREFRPDCVVSYWVHPDGAAAARAAREAGVPSAVIVGGSDVLILPRSPGRRRKVVATLEATDAIITVGQDLKAKVEELGICSEKVHVVYQGVDTSVFSPGNRRDARQRLGLPQSGRVLLWVGRMVPVKGINVLLQACSARQSAARIRLAPDRRRAAAEVAGGGGGEARAVCGRVLCRSGRTGAVGRLVSLSRPHCAAKPFGRHPERAARVAGLRNSFRGERRRWHFRIGAWRRQPSGGPGGRRRTGGGHRVHARQNPGGTDGWVCPRVGGVGRRTCPRPCIASGPECVHAPALAHS